MCYPVWSQGPRVSQMQYTPVLPALGRGRQDNQEFKASLGLHSTFETSVGYMKPCLKTTTKAHKSNSFLLNLLRR